MYISCCVVRTTGDHHALSADGVAGTSVLLLHDVITNQISTGEARSGGLMG